MMKMNQNKIPRSMPKIVVKILEKNLFMIVRMRNVENIIQSMKYFYLVP